MDISNQIVLIAQKPKEVGGMHLLTKVRFFNLKYLCVLCVALVSLVQKGF